MRSGVQACPVDEARRPGFNPWVGKFSANFKHLRAPRGLVRKLRLARTALGWLRPVFDA
jgi:hypothetical protein